jgi:maltooligosyltrehalose trehalohydrolase
MEMGATVEGDGVRFRVWAPLAERVEVELESGLLPLRSEDDGVWGGVGAHARAGHRYRYRLDGQHAYPDPYSRSQPMGPHGSSEIVDPAAFAWHDQEWAGSRVDGLVLYELHVGTLTPRGTFDSAIEQLPRLKDLGVTAVEPMPIAEFPGARNWGYDGVDLFAPCHVYGGPNGFKRFVDAAHGHGLGVILDVVYNHLGPDGNFLHAFSREYFTGRHQTPWGDAVNFAHPRVRQLVLDNARYWRAEYHVDGLRLDATHAILDDSAPHILAELSEAFDGLLIAETHENDPRYLRPVADGGLGIDAVWADDFHHSLRRYLAGDHEGYYARFAGTLDEVARCIERHWLRGPSAAECAPSGFVYALQNHDQIGNRPFGDRLSHSVDRGRYLAASMLLLFVPQTPLLFMGQEFAASTPFQYFTDHNPELGRLVSEGRRKEFAAFSSFRDVPDPQAESTFLVSKLKLEEAEGSPVQDLYRSMLRLRRDDAVLGAGPGGRLRARAARDVVLLVNRERGGAERMLVANFGDAAFEVEVGWRALLGTDELAGIVVRPRSAVVFARDR